MYNVCRVYRVTGGAVERVARAKLDEGTRYILSLSLGIKRRVDWLFTLQVSKLYSN